MRIIKTNANIFSFLYYFTYIYHVVSCHSSHILAFEVNPTIYSFKSDIKNPSMCILCIQQLRLHYSKEVLHYGIVKTYLSLSSASTLLRISPSKPSEKLINHKSCRKVWLFHFYFLLLHRHWQVANSFGLLSQ